MPSSLAVPKKASFCAVFFADDPTEKMPPATTKKLVTPQQVDLLKQWIREGATYAEHWAFVAPQRPALPTVKNDKWARNAIDHFILARLEKEGLTPSPEADRATLDPPADARPDRPAADARGGRCLRRRHAPGRLRDGWSIACSHSPHYGERMALDWLDAARYADTHGYHIDAGRDMTRWREWVIDAFNSNLPFDQFTVEQLAGDLLPNATLEQKIASGFNRNHMINFEGGAIPEEYHTAYIVDRVNTTATVWLGLTVGCAQCHDHKYDPITQKEYYQLYAFFNNVPENGLDGSKGNAAPMLKSADARTGQRSSAGHRSRLKELDEKLEDRGRDSRLSRPRFARKWPDLLASQDGRSKQKSRRRWSCRRCRSRATRSC